MQQRTHRPAASRDAGTGRAAHAAAPRPGMAIAGPVGPQPSPGYFAARLGGLPVTSAGDATERDATDRAAGRRPGAPAPARAQPGPLGAALGPGEALDAGSRARFAPHFGPQVDGVRIHAGAAGDAAARALSARAVTDGRDIAFRHGAYAPGTREGQAVLAHELAHTAQPEAGPVLRRLDGHETIPWGPPAPATPDAVNLPSAAQAARDPASMTGYLAGTSTTWLERQQALETAAGDTPEQRAAMRPELERLVRLSGIGLMASHRAGIEDARDRLTARRAEADGAAAPDRVARAKELENIRNAARMAQQLASIKDELEGYRSELHAAHSDTLFRRGSVGDVLAAAMQNGGPYMEEAQRAPLRDSFAALQENPSTDRYWLFAYGMTQFLEQWRSEQILGIEQATSDLFTHYPLLAALAPGDDAYGMDDAHLQQAAEQAYAEVIARVDEAIGRIATDDIHPFDMPKAVENTRTWLSGPRRTALDEAVQDRQVTKFWIGIGLSFFEAMVVFIPVVGPAIAVGVGAAMLGTQLEDMLDRLAVARAGVDPYANPVGVMSPDSFEWVMWGIGAVLTAAGGAGVFNRVRGALRQPTPALLAEIGEPVGVRTGHPDLGDPRPRELPYTQPADVAAYRGRPVPLAELQPGRRYLWLVDGEGNFVIAQEQQPAVDYPRRGPPGQIKHGDLAPGPGGQMRGQARAGGEISVEVDAATGQRRVVMNDSSSYTFARIGPDLSPLPDQGPESLQAVRRLLARYGTDVSGLELVDHWGNPVPPR